MPILIYPYSYAHTPYFRIPMPYIHIPMQSYCHTVIPQVWVILFSDIVLLTQRRRGTVLMCLEAAIPLSTLRVDDFNCTEGI